MLHLTLTRWRNPAVWMSRAALIYILSLITKKKKRSLLFVISTFEVTRFCYAFVYNCSITAKDWRLFSFTADIDELNICYVLRNEENATSDLFHFSVEDNGKIQPFRPRFCIQISAACRAERSWMCCRMTFRQNGDCYKLAEVKIKPVAFWVQYGLSNLYTSLLGLNL